MKNTAFAAFGGTFALAGLVALSSAQVQAMTVQECSTKYNAAKAAGTLGEKTWNDFRKSDCGDDDVAVAPAAAKAPAAAVAPAPAPNAAAGAAGPAVFPNAVATKYASETASKGRMHTCLDQYKSNKTANANGGMKWIMKGGGYYSECNKRLKAAKA